MDYLCIRLSILDSVDGMVTVTVTVAEGNFHLRVLQAGRKD